jgi:hypothetical protein
MDSTSYHYNNDVKDTEVEEDHLVVPHVYVIEVNYHFKCDICEIRLARIFQQEGNYCLEWWQERTYPSL